MITTQQQKGTQKLATTTSSGEADRQTTTATAAGAASAATTAAQKRRIDSKTMHALIALGAENTTGKAEHSFDENDHLTLLNLSLFYQVLGCVCDAVSMVDPLAFQRTVVSVDI